MALNSDSNNSLLLDSVSLDNAVNDILSTTSAMLQGIRRKEDEFNERFTKIKLAYNKSLDELLHCRKLQETLQKLNEKENAKRQQFEDIIKRNEQYLCELENGATKNDQRKTEKAQELERLAEEVENEKKQIASTLKLKDEINKKKDQILACKLLTKTNFVFSSKKTTGYVTTVTGTKTFTFDPQELSQTQITDNLWNLISEDENLNTQ